MISGDLANELRHVVGDPFFKVLTVVRDVPATIAPESVRGHGEDHRWEFAGIDEILNGGVGVAGERPRPMAAIDAVEQEHDREVGASFGLIWDVEGDIGARRQRRAFDGDKFQRAAWTREVTCFGGAEMGCGRAGHSGVSPCLLEADDAFGVAAGEHVVECVLEMIDAVGAGDQFIEFE